jgi:hypothetical protein
MHQQTQLTQGGQIIIQIDNLLLPVDHSLNDCLHRGEDRLHETALQYVQRIGINNLRLIHIGLVIDLVRNIALGMIYGTSVNGNMKPVDGDRDVMRIGEVLGEEITEDDLYIYLRRPDLEIEEVSLFLSRNE